MIFKATTLLIAAACAVACTASQRQGAMREHLEETTGATINHLVEPLRFFHEEPTFAANARDYLFAGPVEVNRSGQRSYWLWIGAWSTLDHGWQDIGALCKAIERLQVLADGQPMELDMSRSAAEVPGVGSAPYHTPVAAHPAVFVPVTRSQLLTMAGAGHLMIRTQTPGGEWCDWQPWSQPEAGFQAFAAKLRGGNDQSAATIGRD